MKKDKATLTREQRVRRAAARTGYRFIVWRYPTAIEGAPGLYAAVDTSNDTICAEYAGLDEAEADFGIVL